MTYLINHGGVCRTAPATPGLVNTIWQKGNFYIYFFHNTNTNDMLVSEQTPKESGPKV